MKSSRTLLAVTIFAVATVAITWPAITDLANLTVEEADSVFISRVIKSNTDWLFGRGNDLFNIPFFFPHENSLFFSEHHLGHALLVLPFAPFIESPIVLFNVASLLQYFLSGFGVFLLVSRLSRSFWGSIVAGLVYMLYPYRQFQFGHVHVQATQWLPFILWALHRWTAQPTWRRAVLPPIFLVLQALCSLNLTVLAYPGLAIVFGLACLKGRENRRLRLIQMSAMAAATLLLLFPIMLPMVEVHKGLGLLRERWEVVELGAPLEAFFGVPPDNLLYGPWLGRYFRAEAANFMGFVVLYLSAMALVRVANPFDAPAEKPLFARLISVFRSFAKPILLLFAVCAVACLAVAGYLWRPSILVWAIPVGLCALLWWAQTRALLTSWAAQFAPAAPFAWSFAIVFSATMVLAVGPEFRVAGQTYGKAPYNILFEAFPGFESLRAPSRIMMIGALGFSVLAGYGVSRIVGWLKGRASRAAAIFLAVAGIAVETCQPLRWHKNEALLNRGPVDQAIRSLPDDKPIVVVPYGRHDTELNNRSLYHQPWWGRPLVNGYSGHFPNLHLALERDTELGTMTGRVEVLRGFGVGWIAVDTRRLNTPAKKRLATSIAARTDVERFQEIDGVVLYRLSPLQATGDAPRVEIRIPRVQPMSGFYEGKLILVNSSAQPVADKKRTRVRVSWVVKTPTGDVEKSGSSAFDIQPLWVGPHDRRAISFPIKASRRVGPHRVEATLKTGSGEEVKASQDVDVVRKIDGMVPGDSKGALAEVSAAGFESTVGAGRSACGIVTVTNRGNRVLLEGSAYPARVAFDLPIEGSAGKLAGRAPLPYDLFPGESARVPLCVPAPQGDGPFKAEVDVFVEQVAQMRNQGSRALVLEFQAKTNP